MLVLFCVGGEGASTDSRPGEGRNGGWGVTREHHQSCAHSQVGAATSGAHGGARLPDTPCHRNLAYGVTGFQKLAVELDSVILIRTRRVQVCAIVLLKSNDRHTWPLVSFATIAWSASVGSSLEPCDRELDLRDHCSNDTTADSSRDSRSTTCPTPLHCFIRASI